MRKTITQKAAFGLGRAHTFSTGKKCCWVLPDVERAPLARDPGPKTVGQLPIRMPHCHPSTHQSNELVKTRSPCGLTCLVTSRPRLIVLIHGNQCKNCDADSSVREQRIERLSFSLLLGKSGKGARACDAPTPCSQPWGMGWGRRLPNCSAK